MQLRAGGVHVNGSSVEFHAVEGDDGFFSVGVIRHLHERRALRLLGPPVSHNPQPLNRSVFFKDASNVLRGGVKTEVSYEDIVQMVRPLWQKPSGTDGRKWPEYS